MPVAIYRTKFRRGGAGGAVETHEKTYTLHPSKMVVEWRWWSNMSSDTRRGEDVVQLAGCEPDYSTVWEDRFHPSQSLPEFIGCFFLPFLLLYYMLAGVTKRAEVRFGEKLLIRRSDDGDEGEFRNFVQQVGDCIRRLQGDQPVMLVRPVG